MYGITDMVRRILLGLMLALLSGHSSGDTLALQNKMLSNQGRHFKHPKDQLSKFVSYFLAEFHCLQTYTDGSTFSSGFLEELNNLDEMRTVVLGGDWKEDIACKGFLIIADNYTAGRELVGALPRYAEHRLALVLRGSVQSLTKATITSSDIFLDADVILAASQDLTMGFVMAQPRRYFVKIAKFKKWKYSSRGPKDFMGREVKLLTYNCSIFSELGPASSNGTHSWARGVEVRLFNEIAERLNLVPRYKGLSKRPKDANHLWYEKELASGAQDMAFCGVIVSAKKITKSVILTSPFTQLCLKFLVPRPKELGSEWFGIFHPFEPEVWFVTAMVVLGMSFFLQRLTVSVRLYAPAPSIRKYEQLGGSFIEILSILVMTNLPKSAPDQRGVRHLLTWWAMFTLVLSTAYSSGLVTHLTKHEFSPKPKSIAEMVAAKYRWAGASVPDFSELLNLGDSNEVAWKYRFKKTRTIDEHIMLLLRQKEEKQALWGYLAFGGFSLPDYELPDYVMRRYEVTGSCIMEYFIAYAIREGSPYENPINKYIQAFNEAGLTRPLFQKVYHNRYEHLKYVYTVLRETRSYFAGQKGLGLENLIGIFVVWGVGVSLSCLVFVLEVLQRCRI